MTLDFPGRQSYQCVERMPVYKREHDSRKASWFFKFQAVGAKRGTRTIRGFGYATKREAEEAEWKRRVEE